MEVAMDARKGEAGGILELSPGPTPLDNRFGPRLDAETTLFRIWAPGLPNLELLLRGREPLPMTKERDGWWTARLNDAPTGTRYKFRAQDVEFPDLASRQQDGDAGSWGIVRPPLEASARPGPIRPWHEAVICEVHVGTASPDGTFNGLRERLEHFRDVGYTALEIMPVNEFPGARNWGYDGTLIFAPDSAYGTPEDLRALVDRAHELGLCLILDVVYNHFGEVENYARTYLPEWFDENIETPWGPGINFNEEMVRQFYYENAVMWLTEYDFDGLRFDAVHEIKSELRDRFLGELADAAKRAKPNAMLIVENIENSAHWLERNDRNEPMIYTAQWNDDIHHVLAYLVTGEGAKTGYDDPTKDPIADLEKALVDGFIHDREEGPKSDGRTRGGPASKLPPDCFITYVENHDQIGNRADGKRLSSRISPSKLDFLHLVKFVAPQIPLCFMGDEANLASGFPFFVDLRPEDGEKVDARRYKEMREMFKEDVQQGALPHPNDPQTFESAKLVWEDFGQDQHRAALERFRQLSAWRRENVWPLTATPCQDATSIRLGRCLIVNWLFEAGTLTLVLNPNEGPMDIPCLVRGAPIVTGEYDQHGEVLRLGAWSALAWRS
jgi:maltooligosyltrehalose trehalohydrolase